ncbi:right-handed parallel beta-helix repeat-containing protein [Planctomonas psychrotolerans]|uniref:right-handed parallel beta-helix repeat-containing protein n=1 Tax=Planctomonas psychrotolerans TaxID=2528712 RepID=UPI001D0D72A1|nr:right-handed parallel beta-helix repeat-containing protein [Planctomonas psychrotolerans]
MPLRRFWVVILASFVAGALAVGVLWATIAGAAGPAAQGSGGTSSETPPGPAPAPEPEPTDSGEPSPGTGTAAVSAECPEPTVEVATADELEDALTEVNPGDVIGLDPGRYVGNFVAATSGTAAEPIFLCGSTDAVLDGDDPEDGYVFHLDGAEYWNLVGFTVTNGQKGVMADGTVGSVLRELTVHTIGDEAIHLRAFSSDNLVTGNTISETGLRKPKFGEGVYIGTAESNWCDISDCEPDTSDRNVVSDNEIFDTTSESVDVKEGTTGGVVRGNTFEGSAITGADSWVDIKGNGYLIEDNVGTNSPLDGFQTHEIRSGWGTDNVFRSNTAEVNGPGFGYSLTPVLDNVVECDNTATAAAEGVANVECTRR